MKEPKQGVFMVTKLQCGEIQHCWVIQMLLLPCGLVSIHDTRACHVLCIWSHSVLERGVREEGDKGGVWGTVESSCMNLVRVIYQPAAKYYSDCSACVLSFSLTVLMLCFKERHLRPPKTYRFDT